MYYKTVDTCQVHNLSEIYEKYFGFVDDGFFVEVGAADGVRWSNTYGLYNAGWGGLMYEPDERVCSQCVKNMESFPKVRVYHMAIGKEVGTVKLHVGGIGASTTSPEFLESAKVGGWFNVYTREEEVNQVTLDVALENAKVQGSQIDVLSIDTEGNEPDILAGFNIDYWLPSMVIIEAHEHYPGPDRPRTAGVINNYFAKHGYKKIYSDEVNNIYVRPEMDY